MSKAHRGRPLRKEGLVRGVCPITGRTGVKLIYKHETSDGKKLLISKSAHAKFKNIQRIEARKLKARAASEAALAKKAGLDSEEKVEA